MDITEVIELMSMVDSMENIEEVTVTLGDYPICYHQEEAHRREA